MIIDSHQHFWRLSRGDYTWLTSDQRILYQDYLPADLEPMLLANNIRATVLVQAAASEAESRYLFKIAEEHSFVAGVVGWVDFESPTIAQRIAGLTRDGGNKLKGLRPMIQDIADPHWISKTALDTAFEAMTANGLVFDALVKPFQIDALRRRLLRHPKLRAVLDHAGKPDIANNGFDTWSVELDRLARDTATCCKLSGLLTEAGERASLETIAPYVAHAFACFGPQRVLWGSDWPVVNLAGSLTQWLKLARELVGRFAPGHENAVFGGTSNALYQLGIA
jgi:L-fuconolactonase